MTKRKIVNRIAVATGTTKTRTAKIVNMFLEGLIDELDEEGRLELRDFGVFKVVDLEARTGRNPKTGESVEIEAAKHVRFKMGKMMRERLNDGQE
jgi:integration host factor subunit beta